MTGIVEVDTAAMHRLAERIQQAAAEAHAATADAAPLHAAIGALVAPGLVQAMAAFMESWGSALAEVVAEANRLADLIILVARAYQDAESASARAMSL